MKIKNLSLSELNHINEIFMKSDKTIIKYDDRYILRSPQNTWDVNYHLEDKQENKTYLIDVYDLSEYMDTMEIENIKDLEIDCLIHLSWKFKS